MLRDLLLEVFADLLRLQGELLGWPASMPTR